MILIKEKKMKKRKDEKGLLHLHVFCNLFYFISIILVFIILYKSLGLTPLFSFVQDKNVASHTLTCGVVTFGHSEL